MSQHHTSPEGAPSAAIDAVAGRLTAWVENLSKKRHAQWILFGLSVIEGSVFPIPPDPLFFTLCLGSPRKSFWFASICALGSVIGSCIGYAIGSVFFESLGRPLLSALGVKEIFMEALLQYKQYGILTLLLAGFTPVPYAVLTIAAGFNGTLSFGTLVVGSVLGRAIRFSILGGLFMAFGEAAKRFLASHRIALAVGVVGLALLAYFSIRLFT